MASLRRTAVQPFLRSRARSFWCSSVESITSNLLKSSETSGSEICPGGPSLTALEDLITALPPQPVSLPMLLASARTNSPKNQLLNAQFVRRELTARRALVLKLLHSFPAPLDREPAVEKVASIYWERLKDLCSLPPLMAVGDEVAFTAQMKLSNAQVRDQTGEEEAMCVTALGTLYESIQQGGTTEAERVAVDRRLDAVFLARIGMRFLLEHYVASSEPPRDGFAGIVEMRLSPHDLCEQIAHETRQRLVDAYGAAPPVRVVSGVGRDETFTFVPSHIRYIVGELLKNSCVATMRHHDRLVSSGRLAADAPLRPVRVVVAVSEGLVQIKLADEAGGIRRSSLSNVWSYRPLNSKWWKPEDGLSLPVVRLCCKYFNGSLALVPVEGFGTDCYVTLNRLPQDNSERINLYEDDSVVEPSLRSFLFDAQSRRVAVAAPQSQKS